MQLSKNEANLISNAVFLTAALLAKYPNVCDDLDSDDFNSIIAKLIPDWQAQCAQNEWAYYLLDRVTITPAPPPASEMVLAKRCRRRAARLGRKFVVDQCTLDSTYKVYFSEPADGWKRGDQVYNEFDSAAKCLEFLDGEVAKKVAEKVAAYNSYVTKESARVADRIAKRRLAA